ncbi:autotransporter domain-containing protein [Croceicoccus naphthovorans]|uniref:Autotransporter domain-containing protein n=2 Tax=Croceicoccus naphthovorans TaxID=1348774 RepID=A0A0G3XJ92_9SPHN|nr:autotransporter domain-containing protein [Croceicoccus naphthovorans]AKM10669.1 hypothetical protein AB433_12955 [Croceicoccus naphthovorans]
MASTAILAAGVLPVQPALADPAVFFNEDLNAGLQTFLDTTDAADQAYNDANPGATQDSLIFQYDITNTSSNRFAVTDTTGTVTVYVQTTLAGAPAMNTGGGDEGGDGFTNWSVGYTAGDWMSVVAAGYTLSFYSDASYTTSYDINAVGLHVNDWGTCCTTGNTTPDGGTANASEIYMMFNGSTPLLVGGIDASIGGEEHFVAAIDDRNNFSSVTMVPNGSGEIFGAGGYLVFSTLQIGSVPAGSSVVTVGTTAGPISGGENATPETVGDGTYEPSMDGGTLAFDSDDSFDTDLTVTGNGGTIDTGTFYVTLNGTLTDESDPSGALTKTGSGTLLLTGMNTFTGGWDIQQGTLAGSTETIVGNVANSGNLLIDQDTDGSFAGDVSGTGSLTKDGDGNVTLTGTNSYTGGTTISGGTLTGSTTSLTGDVLNNAALVIDQNTDGTFAGDVSGTGSLTKDGDGNVTLIGTNIYTGGTTISGGTLTGSTTSVTGDVLNNAALVIDQDTDGTFAGDVSGTGSLTKDGDGNVTLTGVNTYTGGTTISGGALTGSTISLTGDVLNDAFLVFDQAGDGTFSGDVSGTGSLIKSGGGNVTLTGANSFTGGTLITGGTLTGSTTSLTGDIQNEAALVIDQDVDGDFAGIIVGTGSLTKQGDGNVTLTGMNGFTGGTSILGGTLTASTISLGGMVLNDAILVIDEDADAEFAGSLSGTGDVEKTGSGIVTLSGLHTMTGSTIISEGGLNVIGSYATSAITVGSGGLLTGSGMVGGVLVRDGATLAPSGMMLADGDVTFASGSTLFVNADADGNADLLGVTGALDIQGGMVSVLAVQGTYDWQTIYQIAAADTVSGEFDGVVTDLAFLDPSLVYSASGVSLVMTRNDLDFADVAETANQRASGVAFDATFDPATDEYFAFASLNGVMAREALDALSGEIHATVANTAWQDSARIRRAVLERLDLPRAQGPELWIQIQSGRDDIDGDGNAAGYLRKTTNYAGGFEYGFGQSKLGIAVGYTDGDTLVGSRSSHVSTKGTHGHLYAGTDAGALRLAAGASYADFDVETDRNVAFATIDQDLSADYRVKVYGAYARAGVLVPVGKGAIEPFAGVTWNRFDRDGFAETGETLALDVADEKADWTYSSLGLKGHVTLDPADAVAFRFAAEWQHALDGRSTETTMAFDGGPDFIVTGSPLAKDMGLIDAGLNWTMAPGLSLGLSYGGTVSKQGFSRTGRATLSFRF